MIQSVLSVEFPCARRSNAIQDNCGAISADPELERPRSLNDKVLVGVAPGPFNDKLSEVDKWL